MIRRDWTEAVAHHDGRPCRVCLRWPRELAHIIPRAHDERARGARLVRVHPLAVIPLCPTHHRLYDAHRLDLLAHLTAEEVAHNTSRVGEGEFIRRVCGRDR